MLCCSLERRSPGPGKRASDGQGAGLEISSGRRGDRSNPCPALPAGLRVTFQPAEWPNVKFPAPEGQAWDWSSHGFLLLELRNPDRTTSSWESGSTMIHPPTASGSLPDREVRLKAAESTTVAVAVSRTDPMAHGMRGLPGHAGNPERDGLGIRARLTFITSWPSRSSCISRERRVIWRSSRPGWHRLFRSRESSTRSGSIPGPNWPGKVQSESDLVHRHELEAADLKAHPAPPDRDRFGGWRNGPKQQATGFFRTVKQDGKWWLVDPDGALFISLGVDVVTPNEATILTGRESMFTGLPASGDPLARFYGMARGIHSGPVKEGKTFNFYEANLERTYGTQLPRVNGETRTLKRLKSWGFNTVGNWSDHRLYRNGQVPYVATVSVFGNHARVGSGSDYWGKMHDPFDPRFAESVRNSLRGVVRAGEGRSLVPGLLRGQRAELGRLRRRGRPLRPGPRCAQLARGQLSRQASDPRPAQEEVRRNLPAQRGLEDQPQRLASARGLLEAGPARLGLVDGIQGRPGRRSSRSWRGLTSRRFATSSRPPIPIIFTWAAGSRGGPRKPSPPRPSSATSSASTSMIAGSIPRNGAS